MRRILLVLSVAALMVAMLAGPAGTALAQVQFGACDEDFVFEGQVIDPECRQGVLLPTAANESCRSVGFDIRNDRSFELGGEAPDNRTASFIRCGPGELPVEEPGPRPIQR